MIAVILSKDFTDLLISISSVFKWIPSSTTDCLTVVTFILRSNTIHFVSIYRTVLWTLVGVHWPTAHSLRAKRFRLVLEQRKTEEWDFRFWPREKWNESQKMKEGGTIIRAVFDSRSSSHENACYTAHCSSTERVCRLHHRFVHGLSRPRTNR